jgi:hypothetical protein
MNKIETTLQEKGKEWIIAAMVDGSIGYHTPEHAARLIDRYLSGQREDWCERCMACFNCDLEKMILSDIELFEAIEQRDPDYVKTVIQRVQVIRSLDPDEQMTVSLLYPTVF